MEEAVAIAPNWLVRQRFQKFGARLPKRNVLVCGAKCTECHKDILYPNDKDTLCGECRWRTGDRQRRKWSEQITAVPSRDFDFSEFRYWIASKQHYLQDEAVCRACYQRIRNGPKGRKDHFEKQKGPKTCGRILTDAFKKLLLHRHCVVCKVETSNQLWGIPLCRNMLCVDAWKYDQNQKYLLLEIAKKECSK